MPLFILGGIVITACVIYIIVVDHPELFSGGSAERRQKEAPGQYGMYGAYDAETDEDKAPVKDEPKVIYLPQDPEDIEAEKARRNKKKK